MLFVNKNHPEDIETLKKIIQQQQQQIDQLIDEASSLPRLTETDNHSISPSVLLENLMHNLPGHLYWKDREGHYLGCNKGQAHFLGLHSHLDIIGQTDYDLNWKNEASSLREVDKTVMENRKTYTAEETVYSNDTKFVFLSKKTPLLDFNNDILGILGVSIDITELTNTLEQLRIAKEAAEQASKAKTEFIANVSHDIRTPFSGIISLAETLISQESDPDKKHSLSIIAESSTALLELLNQVIEVSQLSGPALCSRPINANIEDIINNCISRLKPQLNQKPIKIVTDIDKSLHHVTLHAHEIQRILHNLVSNAIKFTRQGRIEINATALNKNQFQIVVKDSGIGIPAEQMESIFNKFTKLKQSYEFDGEGYGLGLWIVKTLTENIKGTITVESNEGSNTTFTLTCPFTSPKDSKQPINKISKKYKKALVIEDNVIAQKAAKILLKDIGYECHIVNNGTKALALKTFDFDFIIIDIGLPDMSGLELIPLLQPKLMPEIEIVIATAHAANDVEFKHRTQELGVRYVFEKPLRKVQLESMILES
jgi:two-component system, OmpR family, aerobic respiration control sensor histidine kinase ArcB